MDTTVNARLAALMLALACGGAAAQGLEDPTRPPARLAPQGVAGAAPEAAPVDNTPRLQAVLVGRGPGARRVAVIDGQTVRQGHKFKGALLERVTETEAVLVRGGRKQVLKLHPASAPQADAP